MKNKPIEKIRLNKIFDVNSFNSSGGDLATGSGLLKVMEKINTIIERINETK